MVLPRYEERATVVRRLLAGPEPDAGLLTGRLVPDPPVVAGLYAGSALRLWLWRWWL